ncbi:DUF2520 domain-containing protein [Aurantibacter sp.]|uniref:Rossmann-like and DUF2520 domain-containing protein n=1 Tax=Aurantibacter sp. TaxID=2807103 RepID=UPI003263CBBE
MIKVAIIGGGNVAYHLTKAFKTSKKVEVALFSGRDDLSKKIINIDICIIAVSDSAIVEVAKKLLDLNVLVAHTSGSVAIKNLPNKRCGVFYPLQTFSKEKKVNFNNIPICLESNNTEDFNILKILAGYISNSIAAVSSEQRRALHVAAVVANNFSNHMFTIAEGICKENDLSFDLLKPLILETADKIKTLDPFIAQTGPAKRHDLDTIQNHENLLKNSIHKKLYKQITQSILNTYGQKL